MVGYNFAGIIGVLFFFVVWLFLYFRKKELKKEMLIMSLLATPLGPLSEVLYFKDYWRPEYLFTFFGFGIEDLCFAFFIGGIGAVAYEEIFIKKLTKIRGESSKLLGILGLVGILLLLFLNLVLGINSIYASSIAFIVLGIVILSYRRDLLKISIYNGIIVALIMLVFYIFYLSLFPNIIEDWWKLKNISGIFIFGAPIEEIIWGFAWGFLAGPLYEFWRGYKAS